MVVKFIDGPQDGLILDNVSESTYAFYFPLPVTITKVLSSVIMTDPVSKRYVYRRDIGSDKFAYGGVK
jgi:hypothetical protein